MSDTIRQQVERASDMLSSVSCSARLDSEVLLAHCLQRQRSYLFTWPDRKLTGEQLECFRELVRRRMKPEPVAYLVGRREFYSMSLITTPATLVPRPETEMLVDCVIDEIHGQAAARVLELGTGTGAIALAIKQHHSTCQITATDVSPDALDVARRNADKFGLQVQFVLSDWYQSVPADPLYNVIVSNPPYIAALDPYLSQGDLPAEPYRALCSGDSGLESLQVIIDGADRFLKPGGLVVLEHGHEQTEEVQSLLSAALFTCIETCQDFNGLPRMTLARSVVE